MTRATILTLAVALFLQTTASAEPDRFRVYPATITSCYDADTCDTKINLGFGMTLNVRLRLYGLNAPELRGVERPAGLVSRDWLRALIVGRRVKLLIPQNKHGDRRGKYGRVLAEIELNDGTNVNDALVQTGHAKTANY